MSEKSETLEQMSVKVEEARRLASEAKEVYEKLKAEADLQEERLMDEMRDASLRGFKRADGTSVSLKRTVYARVEDRDSLIAVIKDMGMEDQLLRVDFVKARLNEIARGLLDEGKAEGGFTEFPTGMYYYATPYISISKS